MLTGWGSLLSQRPEEALQYLEDALTFEKDDASAIGALSLANVALGRFEEGIAAASAGWRGDDTPFEPSALSSFTAWPRSSDG
jgi:hypothetical protein